MNLRSHTLITTFVLGMAMSTQGFIYESADEFSMDIDYDNDGIMDLVIVDRLTGQVRPAFSQPDGTFSWAEAQTSGVLEVAAVTYGLPPFSTEPHLFLTAPYLNRAQGLRAASPVPLTLNLPGIEPGMIISVPHINDVFYTDTSGFITSVGSYQNFQTPLVLEGAQTLIGVGAARLSPGLVNPWHGAHGNDLGHDSLYIWREDNPNGLESRVRIARKFDGVGDPISTQARLESEGALSITGAAAAYVIGEDGSGDAGARWLFTWNRQGTSARFSSVSLAAPVVIGAQLAFALPGGIDSIVLIKRPSAAPQIAVSISQGSVVKIYNFDGTQLTFVENVTPGAGRRASGIVPWKTGDADGGFSLLERQGTSGPTTHVTRYARDGSGHYQPVGTDALTKLSKIVRSNTFFWQGEPMVDPDAKLLGLRRSGDWTTGFSTVGNTTEATSESFVSSSQGLGNPAQRSAGDTPFYTTHTSGNQTSSSLSVFASDAAIGEPNKSRVNYSPVSGRYMGELIGAGPARSLKVTLSAKGAYSVKLYYRLNGGAWQIESSAFFSSTITRVIQVSSDTLFEAMSLNEFGFSPIFSSTYAVGPSPTPPGSGIDANGNGLIDEWERLFGITDPTGDADGDGQSNFAEHNAGTDPRDATKYFVPPVTLPALSIGVELTINGSFIRARWPTSDPSVRLESSTTLGIGSVWAPVTTGISIEGAEYVFSTVPTPGEQTRFFRLARY
ncbi:MAG: thrombospondin type 3 repeat-containing protein [Verrucomicrobiota bacterium]